MISLTVLKSLGFLLGSRLYPLHLKRLVSSWGNFLSQGDLYSDSEDPEMRLNKDVTGCALLASHHLGPMPVLTLDSDPDETPVQPTGAQNQKKNF